jgi:hypothetical protein
VVFRCGSGTSSSQTAPSNLWQLRFSELGFAHPGPPIFLERRGEFRKRAAINGVRDEMASTLIYRCAPVRSRKISKSQHAKARGQVPVLNLRRLEGRLCRSVVRYRKRDTAAENDGRESRVRRDRRTISVHLPPRVLPSELSGCAKPGAKEQSAKLLFRNGNPAACCMQGTIWAAGNERRKGLKLQARRVAYLNTRR